MPKQPYWFSTGGRPADYEIDLSKSFDAGDPSETILSQFLGEPAGYIDPDYADLITAREREFAFKAEVNGIEYGPGKLIDFSIENSLSLGDELELGTVIPNKLTIRFRTQQSFPPNAKIAPFVALRKDDGSLTDWLPLGEFFVDSRSEDRGVWTYTCYDALIFADVPYLSELSFPATMQDVWDEICDQVGFTYDSSVVIDPSYTIPAAPTGYTCRQVMGFVASANAACAYMGKDGTLRFRRITKDAEPTWFFSESDYIRQKKTNPVKTYTRVVVIYDPDEGLFYEAGDGDDSTTMYIENPFGTQEMADAILSEIDGFSYTPISMPAIGFPHLEQGEIILLGATESISWEDADVAWQDAHFPWDGQSVHKSIILHQVLDFRGGVSMHIEAPARSDQKSEFPVEGTLEQAISRLNRNAVKKGKLYYGVQISPDYGLKVERSDGKGDVILNADELRFRANGQDALWFDVPNLRWKFSGTLEGVDGTFSGTVEAGTIVGGTINGTSINGATITGGTIVGTSIVGSTITGGTIQTTGTYPRVQLSSSQNMLSAEKSATEYISIVAYNSGTGTPIINLTAPSGGGGQISGSAGELGIVASNDLALGALFGRVYIIAPNGVYANGKRIDI